MTSKPKKHDDSLDNGSGDEPESSDEKRQPDYDVGFRKPPKGTRFQKGRSGNPQGRPRKAKTRAIKLSDATFDSFFEQEAYRLITVRENGKVFQMPAAHVAVRNMSTEAAKGHRLKQQNFFKFLREKEDQHFQTKVDKYVRLSDCKRRGEEKIAEHAKRNLPPPDLLPHPDDIILNPTTGEAYVRSPETKEDLLHIEEDMAVRDFSLLCYVHLENKGRGLAVNPEEKLCQLSFSNAMALNALLPQRFQRTPDDFRSLQSEYESLTRRERKRRIAADFTHLQKNRLKPRFLTPELEEQVIKDLDEWLKSSG